MNLQNFKSIPLLSSSFPPSSIPVCCLQQDPKTCMLFFFFFFHPWFVLKSNIATASISVLGFFQYVQYDHGSFSKRQASTNLQSSDLTPVNKTSQKMMIKTKANCED